MSVEGNGSMENHATIEVALAAFTQYACPQQRVGIIDQTRRNTADPLDQLNSAIEFLCRAAV